MSSRPRADWVYRDDERSIEAGGVQATPAGTYTNRQVTLGTGPTQAQGRILYDSNDYFAMLTRRGVTAAGVASILRRESRAEGRKPMMLAVRGIIQVVTDAWALGDTLELGLRIGVFEQDGGTGTVLLDADYSMFTSTVIGDSTPSFWANQARNNCWERRIYAVFNDSITRPSWTIPVAWKGRKYLSGNECFALYLEMPVTSVTTVQHRCWLKTLVSDEAP